MTNWVPIAYRGYWDVPQIFSARHNGLLFLFDCAFSEELDDYTIFLLAPDVHEENLPTDWTTFAGSATRQLGTVRVSDVRFDPTRRKQVDASVLETLLVRPAARAPG